MDKNGVRALVVDPSSALSDPALITYNHWLQGHSVERAAQLLCSAELSFSFSSSSSANAAAASEMILRLYRDEVHDAHRDFAVFEALLEQPKLLGVQSQIECPVNDVEQRHKLIASYYGFDSRVLREFMGLKLTSKLRSNLDDISDRTHVPIRSVRRQFDNLRRVHSRFDEVSVFRGNNTQHISEEFCLPTPLARRYAAASFLLYHRFDLEMSDRKYQFLSWGDCEYMALQVMAKWVTRPILMIITGGDDVVIDSIFGNEDVNLSAAGNKIGGGGGDGNSTTGVPSSLEGHDGDRSVENGSGGGSRIGSTMPTLPLHSPTRNHSFESMMIVDRSNSSNTNSGGSSVTPPAAANPLRRASSDPVSSVTSANRRVQQSSFSSPPLVESPFGPSDSISQFASVDATGAQFALERRSSVDLAPAWLSDVRDMKTQVVGSSSTATNMLVERVVLVLRPSINAGTKDLRKMTKDVVRNMLVIGGNLSQAKELRDFFEDVIEKVCGPLLSVLGIAASRSGSNDSSGGSMLISSNKTMGGIVFDYTRIFFRAVFDASCVVGPITSLPPRRRERLLSSWRRYLDVIGCCTLRMMKKRLKMM
jgi:hypothetical protein